MNIGRSNSDPRPQTVAKESEKPKTKSLKDTLFRRAKSENSAPEVPIGHRKTKTLLGKSKNPQDVSKSSVKQKNTTEESDSIKQFLKLAPGTLPKDKLKVAAEFLQKSKNALLVKSLLANNGELLNQVLSSKNPKEILNGLELMKTEVLNKILDSENIECCLSMLEEYPAFLEEQHHATLFIMVNHLSDHRSPDLIFSALNSLLSKISPPVLEEFLERLLKEQSADAYRMLSDVGAFPENEEYAKLLDNPKLLNNILNTENPQRVLEALSDHPKLLIALSSNPSLCDKILESKYPEETIKFLAQNPGLLEQPKSLIKILSQYPAAETWKYEGQSGYKPHALFIEILEYSHPSKIRGTLDRHPILWKLEPENLAKIFSFKDPEAVLKTLGQNPRLLEDSRLLDQIQKSKHQSEIINTLGRVPALLKHRELLSKIVAHRDCQEIMLIIQKYPKLLQNPGELDKIVDARNPIGLFKMKGYTVEPEE